MLQSIANLLESKPETKVKKLAKDNDRETVSSSQAHNDQPETKPEPETHKGKLIIDATVAEQAIRFPTDLGLLNEVREISESLIDTLYPVSGLKKKRRKAIKLTVAVSQKESYSYSFIKGLVLYLWSELIAS